MKAAGKFALALAVLSALVYAGDYLSLRYRIPNREPLGSFVIRAYYAVPQKDPHREELIFLDPQTEVCTHSLFPHDGHRPCWYVSGHTQQRIQM
jgi:hypothetical protein